MVENSLRAAVEALRRRLYVCVREGDLTFGRIAAETKLVAEKPVSHDTIERFLRDSGYDYRLSSLLALSDALDRLAPETACMPCTEDFANHS